MKRILAGLMLLGFSTNALAAPNALDVTKKAVSVALDEFKASHPELVGSFQGVKTWFEDDLIKVRVYLPNNASMVFNCMKHDEISAGTIMCHMEM